MYSVLTIETLCDLLSIKVPPALTGNVIERIASLEKAQQTDAAALINRGEASVFTAIDQAKIRASRAGVILACDAHLLDDPALAERVLLVPDTIEALARIKNYQEQQLDHHRPPILIDPTAIIHPSAIIEAGATIGPRVRIDAAVVVGKMARIGADTHLKPNVVIGDFCLIGNNCLIHSGVVIGSDGFGFAVSSQGMKKIPHFGIVKIGNHVEIGALSAIDRALFDQTYLADGVKLDNLVHVAHNVQIGAHTAILAQTGIAGSVTIGAGCQIGGQVAIKDHVTIGNRAKIVSKSAVIEDLVDGVTVAGQPAKPFMQWKREMAFLAALPEKIKAFQESQQLFSGARKSFFSRLKNLFTQ